MTARWLAIADRHRRSPGWNASIEDFTTLEGDAASADVLLRNPRLSLYSLEVARREAIFAEVPATVDLTEAPFVYLRQYETANRLLAVPFAELLSVASELPPIDRFVMMYMTGRCGSTLLSHAFNAMDGAVSLSEPDAPIELVRAQRAKALPPEEMRALFEASVRLLFRTTDNRMPAVCVLKLRSELIQIADLIQAAFPQATNLFLYRDAVGWVGSFYRIFARLGVPDPHPLNEVRSSFDGELGLDADRLLPFLGPPVQDVTTIEYLTMWWLGVIERYLAAVERGLPVTAFRHEDITGRPEAVLQNVAKLCNLPGATLRPLRAVRAKDAQAGTPLAQEGQGEAHLRLAPEQIRRVQAIVGRHPLIGDPAFRIPRAVDFA